MHAAPEDRAVRQPPGAVAWRFGRFRLLPGRRLLLDGDREVRLGARALDLLVALVEHAGQVVSHERLTARVWPRGHVEETNLRVHVSALRRALGDGPDATRFIRNVPGRGYSFIAPVAREPATTAAATAITAGAGSAAAASTTAPTRPPPAPRPSHNLPHRLTRLIGRDEAVRQLADQVSTRRLVSIVGPGGLGKTTVAVALAEDLVPRFADGVCFVDLSVIRDPAGVPAAVAAALELAPSASRAVEAIHACLQDRHLLLVLDNCEHVAHGAALLLESLLGQAPRLHVLTTSREALQAAGEKVHRLAPLAVPPAAEAVDAAGALAYGAVQLFVERATGHADTFALSDADAPLVADLCLQLNGMPLAIEFVAARVHGMGLAQLVQRLSDRLTQLTDGRRAALPRHRTLATLLDWSYDLLPARERAVLQCLAAFQNPFTLAAACAVATTPVLPEDEVVVAVLELAAKSLVAADTGGTQVRYRLMETTRAYALDHLERDGQARDVRRRHARWLRDHLAEAEVRREVLARREWTDRYARVVDDLRAAIGWCFAHDDTAWLGAELVALGWGITMDVGRIDEHLPLLDRALAVVRPPAAAADDALPAHDAALLELRLLTARATTGAQALDPQDDAAAFARAHRLARQLGDPGHRVAPDYGAWGQAFGSGRYPEAQAASGRIARLARDTGDAGIAAFGDRLDAIVRHYLGEHAATEALARRLLPLPPPPSPVPYLRSMPRSVSLRIVLSRSLWLQGRVDEAVQVAEEARAQAAHENPYALAQQLGSASCPLALWRGDIAAATAVVAQLDQLARCHASRYWQAWADGFVHALARPRTGDAAPASPPPGCTHVKALDTLVTVCPDFLTDAVVARQARGEAGWCAPEVLRLLGERALRARADGGARGAGQAAAGARQRADRYFDASLCLARSQQALSWELRTALSQARAWSTGPNAAPAAARDRLEGVLSRFREGLDTQDLRDAAAFLAT